MTASFDYEGCTEADLWRHVGGHLEAAGIRAVLVGGAVVAIYTEGAYRSADLDFVAEASPDRIERAMAELGFERRGRFFAHPRCRHLFVEFVSGPLGIGDDLDIEPEEKHFGDRVTRILSPTDCVRDRLASFIHFKARECLDQAALVARAHAVEWPRIRAWCHAEGAGGPEAFDELVRLAGATPS